MKVKKPIYMLQCGKCKRTVATYDVLRCCGKVSQWEERGKSMKEARVRVEVSGYIEMSQGDFDKLEKSYGEDLHMGLVYAIHMGYVDSTMLEFDTPEHQTRLLRKGGK